MTGGRGGGDGGGGTLSSTELLLPSADSWTYSAALPSPRSYLRGATLNNKVVVTGTNSGKYYNSLHNDAGGFGQDYDFYNDILEFSAEEQIWKKVGSMTMKRISHATSVINYNSIEDYCN